MVIEIYDNYSKKLKKKNVFFWNCETKYPNSIDFILDKNKKKIKNKYLSIIEEIDNKNKKKNNHFYFKKISLDQLSLISEKNPFKSKGIYDCLKFLALEDLIKNKKIKKVIYKGVSTKIDSSIKDLSHELNFEYKTSLKKNLVRFKFLSILRGIYFFYKFICKNNKSINVRKNFAKVTFFSYFLHFKKNNSDSYNSYLWDGLSEKLKMMKINSNWMHFFVPSSQIRNIYEAETKLNRINYNTNEKHLLLNNQISFYKLLIIFIKYLSLVLKNWIYIKDEELLKNSISKTNFYYFLDQDIYKSYYGEVLIYNLHMISILDLILSTIPKQKIGFYLLEGQSWEKCLNILWKKYKHGKIIGYIHSTLRFWDLRNFKCKKEFNNDKNPDLFLFNGKYSKNIGIKNFYPKEKSKVVEAVRYISFLEKTKYKINKTKILLIGDMNDYENHYVAKEMAKVKFLFPKKTFYYKPHPSNTPKMIRDLKSKYKFLKILKPLKEIHLENYFKVVCTNSTSAILDCIIKKIDFCSIKSYSTLDLFPLDNKEIEKKRIYTTKDLIKFFKNKKNKHVKQNYLNLNEDLKNWKKIINCNYSKK